MIEIIKKNLQQIYLSLIFVIAFLTYFFNYQNPNAVFWDENYHIASAQKYMSGTMYMEPHPPLGKMFIALGEFVINPNKGKDLSAFSKTDYIQNGVFPKDYSFAGVRFFPTLFAFLSSFLIYLIADLILKNKHFSLLFTSLYLFENGLIVHSRSAMLESGQIFFMLLSVYYFLKTVIDDKNISFKNYIYLGLLVGVALSIKANSAILTLLFVFLFLFDKRELLKEYQITLMLFLDLIFKAIISVSSILFVFVSIFYLHTSIGSKIEDNRYYKASIEYKKIILENETSNPKNFLTMFKDNLIFMKEYQEGVPKLDYCKAQGENGSFAIGWPIGHKAINYRWTKTDNKVKYLYLQSNPIIFFTILCGVLLSSVLILSRLFFSTPIQNERYFYLTTVFTLLYFSYMIAVIQIDRVMYLYHYFMPLLFGLFATVSLFGYFFDEYIKNNNKILIAAMSIFALEVFGIFYYFKPFSYYEYLTTQEFLDRTWFDFWELRYVK